MSHYTHFSMKERCQLLVFLDMGLGVSEVANRLGRHRSSVYRELNRNGGGKRYSPALGDAQARKRRPGKALKLLNPLLYRYVYNRLKKGWSPEQIVGRMRLEKQDFNLCAETIYRYVYHHGQRKLWQYLPSKRMNRRKRSGRNLSRCRYGAIRLITKRPEKIDQRKTFGHWEGDLIEFKGTKKKTVTTLVERKSRLVKLIKNVSKQSREVMIRINEQLIQARQLTCYTITLDQGSEFADYHLLEVASGCKVYYCEPRSPWQKGGNENMNGRLRRYLPRKTNIDQITQAQLDQIADKMNTTPRKCLGFKTPKELFLKHIYKSCRTRM